MQMWKELCNISVSKAWKDHASPYASVYHPSQEALQKQTSQDGIILPHLIIMPFVLENNKNSSLMEEMPQKGMAYYNCECPLAVALPPAPGCVDGHGYPRATKTTIDTRASPSPPWSLEADSSTTFSFDSD